MVLYVRCGGRCRTIELLLTMREAVPSPITVTSATLGISVPRIWGWIADRTHHAGSNEMPFSAEFPVLEWEALQNRQAWSGTGISRVDTPDIPELCAICIVSLPQAPRVRYTRSNEEDFSEYTQDGIIYKNHTIFGYGVHAVIPLFAHVHEDLLNIKSSLRADTSHCSQSPVNTRVNTPKIRKQTCPRRIPSCY